MAEDKDAKTEEPTAKRMGKAWNEGNIPVSQEIRSVAILLGALIVVGVLAPGFARDLSGFLRTFLERPESMALGDIESFRTWFLGVIIKLALFMAFPMFVLIVAAFVGTTGQIGLVYTPKRIGFKLSNISPIAGFKRMFSVMSLVEAGKGIVKMLIVGLLMAFLIVPMMSHPDKLIGQDLETTLSELHSLIVMILFLVVLTMVALAAVDYIYQRWSHKEKLKMTKQEVKDEHKEQEGDPKVKSRIRNLRLERHRQRMMAAVPKASVIITNPTHYAVALQYDIDAMAAPRVVAKGVDYLAKRIRQVAETHEVPIIENPPLARALYAAVEVDQEIPQEHYKAVAEVIGYVMRLKGKRIAS
jgi:flagellar biosynthetic protein FlhB